MPPEKDKPDESGLVAIMLDSIQTARLLGVARSTFWKLYTQGRTPEAVRLSDRVVRWRKAEIEAWVHAGCPTRDKWKYST